MFKVAVLLSTFNGEKYILDQLKSIKNQKKVRIKIFAIDDGSKDRTVKILKEFEIPKKIYKSKKFKNPVKNFLHLIDIVPSSYDFYCFADQDDYWFYNKLSYSISKLLKHDAEICGSRTFYTNEKLQILRKSLLFKKKPCLRNALVQSITGGNTQVWTRKFNNILKKIKNKNPASHDWYLYQTATLFNFKFLYLKKPLVYYRQHKNNVIGSNTGFFNTFKRVYWGFSGRYKLWHDMNERHLKYIINHFNIDKNNVDTINKFYKYRDQSLFNRINNYFLDLKVFRQTFNGNLMLFLALIFKKI